MDDQERGMDPQILSDSAIRGAIEHLKKRPDISDMEVEWTETHVRIVATIKHLMPDGKTRGTMLYARRQEAENP